jgi:D-threonate/D-erythronate kinase
VQALVVDTQTEAALHALAQVTLAGSGAWFWVGSGGLAREIASVARRQAAAVADDDTDTDTRPPTHSNAPVLILVGSLSAVSERQCAMLRERGGVKEQIVPPAMLREGRPHDGWLEWQARIGATLSAGEDLLLRIGRDDAFDPAEGARLSQALADLVGPHVAKTGGLIATGGETARAILTTAGIGGLQLVAEVEAGVAIARPLGEALAHRPGIVTKAGAFGTDRALYAAWRRLRGVPEPDALAP